MTRYLLTVGLLASCVERAANDHAGTTDGSSTAAATTTTSTTVAETAEVDSTSASTDTGSSEIGSTSGIGSTSDTGSSSESGVSIDCAERNPDYECVPMDCDAPTNGYDCGSVAMDDDGCMRAFCREHADCPADLVCYKHSECDPTAFCWTFAGCSMQEGACECGAVGGCPVDPPPFELQTGHCIPVEIRPC